MLSVLIGLGTWQVFRLDYKNSLVRNIKENSKLPAIQVSSSDLKNNAYRNVDIRGVLNNSKTIFYYRLKNNVPGYEVITPLVLENGSSLLLSRGWVKDQVKVNGSKNIRVQGYLIDIYKGNIVSPENDIRKNIWFDLDIIKLKTYINGNDVLPFILLSKLPEDLMVGDKDLGFDIDNLTNNHLGYAITWFALALILLIIFFIDYKNRGKNERL